MGYRATWAGALVLCAVGAGIACESPEAPRVPAPSPVFDLAPDEVDVLYWVGEYQNQVRRIFGASVNALANRDVPTTPPLPSRESWLRDWSAIEPRWRACTACQGVLPCPNPQANVEVIKASTMALRNVPTPELNPDGGSTCGSLLERACARCAQTPDGPGYPPAGQWIPDSALEGYVASVHALANGGGAR